MMVSCSDYIKVWKISSLGDHAIELECIKTINYVGNMFTRKGFVVPEVQLPEVDLIEEDINFIQRVLDNKKRFS